MPNFLLGKDGGLYFSTAVVATPTVTNLATVVTNAKDVSIGVSVETEDITTRASGGWENSAPTIKAGSISATLQWTPADAFFTAVKTAFLNNTEIFIAALDQLKSVTGAQGLASNMIVSKFDVKQPIKGAQTVDIEFKPSSWTTWLVTA